MTPEQMNESVEAAREFIDVLSNPIRMTAEEARCFYQSLENDCHHKALAIRLDKARRGV